jgi:hypothetical protein
VVHVGRLFFVVEEAKQRSAQSSGHVALMRARLHRHHSSRTLSRRHVTYRREPTPQHLTSQTLSHRSATATRPNAITVFVWPQTGIATSAQ